MSDERIVRYTLETLPPGEMDRARIDTMTDEDLERAIATDPDSDPPMPADWSCNADGDRWLRLDEDVAAAFRAEGEDWRARVNDILRAHLAGRDAAE